MTVETVIDKEHLREEMLRTARSFPQSFPVILESFENDSSNTPDVKTFTSDEIDQYIEIVQEFSRERFPEEAKRQAELRAMRDMSMNINVCVTKIRMVIHVMVQAWKSRNF